ncbi:hypothetical protein F4703DRAFT_1792986 [Phycomyces blakesleeanus]
MKGYSGQYDSFTINVLIFKKTNIRSNLILKQELGKPSNAIFIYISNFYLFLFIFEKTLFEIAGAILQKSMHLLKRLTYIHIESRALTKNSQPSGSFSTSGYLIKDPDLTL